MNKIAPRSACLIILILILFAWSSIPAAAKEQKAYLQLGGTENQDPLRITVLNNGRLAVEVWQPEFPFAPDYVYTQQYAAENSWGSNIFFTAGEERIRCFTDYYRQTNSPQTAVQLDLGEAVLEQSGNQVTAVWQTEQLQLKQIIAYEPQSWSFTQEWQITSQTDMPLQNLLFTHGGDTNLGGVDQVCSSWQETENLLAIWPQDLSVYGPMFFSGRKNYPADSFFAGLYWQGYEQVTQGELANTTSSAYVDSASLLQWQKDELLPGQTWTIGSRQQFNPAGIIQIVPPQPLEAEPATEAQLEFTVFYLGASDPDISWDAATDSGWEIQGTVTDQVGLSGEPGGYMLKLSLTADVPAQAAAGHVEAVALNLMHSDDPWTEYGSGASIIVTSAPQAPTESETEATTTTTTVTEETAATTTIETELSSEPDEETTPMEEEEIVRTGNSSIWQLVGSVMLLLAFTMSWLIYRTNRKQN